MILDYAVVMEDLTAKELDVFINRLPRISYLMPFGEELNNTWTPVSVGAMAEHGRIHLMAVHPDQYLIRCHFMTAKTSCPADKPE